jgi:hypothetical protein
MTAAKSTPAAQAAAIGKQLDYLAKALKAPRIREAAARLGDQARDAGWSHEETSPRCSTGKSARGTPPGLI